MRLPVVLTPGEDGYTVVECPALIGCVSQGRTRDEALANIREVIEAWLEAQRELTSRDFTDVVEIEV